jgi:hypothetical protein
MAGVNRHVREDTEDILAPVNGNVEVEVSDFLLLNNTDGTVGQTNSLLLGANNYVFPFSYAKSTTGGSFIDNVLSTQFIGIAMTASPLGVTNNITVATAGVFRYPLPGDTSAVTEGAKIGAVSPAANVASTKSGVSNQFVINHATQSGRGTTAYLGYCTKTDSGASFVDFRISTAFNGGRIL